MFIPAFFMSADHVIVAYCGRSVTYLDKTCAFNGMYGGLWFCRYAAVAAASADTSSLHGIIEPNKGRWNQIGANNLT